MVSGGLLLLLVWIEPVGTIATLCMFGLGALTFKQATSKRVRRWGEADNFHKGQLLQQLQQNTARQVFLCFRIDNNEILIAEYKLLYICERNVGTGLGVVEPTVRILLDKALAGLLCGGHDGGPGCFASQCRRKIL